MSLRQVSLGVGDRLPSVTKTVTSARMALFEAAGQQWISEQERSTTPVNIHTDSARAREMGLDQPIASGQMSFAYLHELLDRQFGADFRQGGRLSVTFLKPVRDGDVVTAHGVVTAKEDVGNRTRISIEVWLENHRGVRTSSGEAEVTVPSPLT